MDTLTDRSIEVAVPGDKSLAIRALLLALLADGPSLIWGVPRGHITHHTLAALSTLGASVEVLDGDVDASIGVRVTPPKRITSGCTVECGGSATLARILLGLLAGAGVDALVTGSPMLSRRPMARVQVPLRDYFGRDVVTCTDGHLPAQVVAGPGPQRIADDDVIKPGDSAQVRASLFFAAAAAQTPLSLWSARPGRRHSEQLLRRVGVDVVDSVVDSVIDSANDSAVDGVDGRARHTRVTPRPVRAFEFTTPKDPSQAAFVQALAAGTHGVGVNVKDVVVDVERTGFLRCLERMGCTVLVTDSQERFGLHTADVTVRGPSALQGVVVEAAEIPDLVDEVPVLMALCCVAQSPSVLRGLTELRVKESDRLDAMATVMRAFGGAVSIDGDDVRIEPAPSLLAPATPIVTHRDHRIGMSALVLGAIGQERLPVTLDDDDDDAVAESWPNARKDFAAVRSALRAPARSSGDAPDSDDDDGLDAGRTAP